MSHVIETPVEITEAESTTPIDRPSVFARANAFAIHPAVTLAWITIVGGCLRFWKLSQPALWGDEVATFRRVCGTFQQLVDQLAVGGFTPLHYLLYYWIGKHATLTPTMMRLPPAIFGTLLIPAMYFLARQLVRPPVAMLAAAFTACSAYQLTFSRDAKMYSDLWLFGVLHMGCFFWWLRTRSVTAWWGWIAAGTAMMGMQFVGAALYPIELLIVLTAPKGHWKCLWPMVRYLVWLPAAVIFLPVAAFLRWRDRDTSQPQKGSAFEVLPSSPLYPGERDRGRGVLGTVGDSVSDSSSNEEALSPALSPSTGRGRSNSLGGEATASSDARSPVPSVKPQFNAPLVTRLLIGWRLAWRRWVRRRRVLARFPWPSIVLFALGLMIAGAAPYAYYVKFNRFFSDVYNADQGNLNWMRTGITWVAGYNAGRNGLDLIRYTATAYTLGWEWPRPTQWVAVDERTGKLLMASSIGLLMFALLGALPLTRRKVWTRRRSILWISAWLVLPAYAFYCASMPEASSPITWVEQLLLKNVPAVKWPALPIAKSWAETFHQWRQTPAWHELWVGLHASFVQIGGGFTRGNLNLVSIGILLVAVAAWTIATLRMNRRSLTVATQTVLTLVGIFVLCVLLRIAIATPFPRSVWMPRYLAFIWPAFAILLAALFYRLPTRPIRWVGIALLLIVNLSVHGAHVLAGSEPPTELMARDIVESQPPLHSRLFSSIPQQGGSEPGTGVLESVEARYYLAVLSGKPISPDEVRGGGYENQFLIGKPRFLASIGSLVSNAIQDSAVDRLVVWEQLQPKQVAMNDPLEKVLPSGWQKVSEDDYVGRDHWTWTDYYVFRRHVYQKQ